MHSGVYNIFRLDVGNEKKGYRNYVRSIVNEEISDDDRIDPYGENILCSYLIEILLTLMSV